jgi:hypothetical protein
MDKDYDGKITIDEFITVFLQAEEILQKKIIDSRNSIENQVRQKKEASFKLEEIQRTEKLNSYGISADSKLNLTIVEGANFDLNSFTYFYVVAKCGNFDCATDKEFSDRPLWKLSHTL